MAKRDLQAEADAVRHMLAKERLSIDDAQPGRTCFLSHIGAQPKLSPGPWIGHRELLWGLALANLTPAQRTSLARAVLIDHRHEFGVGHLRLEAWPSGLPLGGSSLAMRPRKEGPHCLYTWALGHKPTPVECDWLLLRAQPQWSAGPPPKKLHPKGLGLLAQLGGEVVVLVDTAVSAVQVAAACAGKVELAAHPRFAPFVEGLVPDARVLLWPHDALEGTGLRRHEVVAVVLVDAPESVRRETEAWIARRENAREVELVEITCPGRATADEFVAFWKACAEPAVFLTGDPAWVKQSALWLRELGASVEVQGAATQLSLL